MLPSGSNYRFLKPGEIDKNFQEDIADIDPISSTTFVYNPNVSLSYDQQRQRLPIFNSRNHILYLLEKYQVLVLVGETGCGKSTQLPQMEYSWVRGISPGYILLVLLFIYLFGMDIMLYFRIQDYPLRKDNVNTTDYPANCNEISPFCYVSVKGVMLDQINEYIFGPAITIFDMIFRISDIKFITPNMISFFHVFVAIVSGKCVSSHLIWTRRLGVVLFEIRTLLDDLDGHVARKRKHVHGETSEIGTTGYIVDGVCDLLGVSFFMLGVLIFLKNNPSRRDYTPVVDKTDFTEAYRKKITNRRLYQVIACVSIQLTLSSIAWNRYIALYQDLLERPRVSQILEFKELLVFRSNYFLLIAFLWRILNVHSYLHVILLAVVLDKVSELFKNIKLIGFVVLLALICLTEMHILLVEEFFYESNFIYRNVTTF